MSKPTELPQDTASLLAQILTSLNSLRQEQSHLATAIDTLNARVNSLAAAGVQQTQPNGTDHDVATTSSISPRILPVSSPILAPRGHASRGSTASIEGSGRAINGGGSGHGNGSSESTTLLPPASPRRSSVTSKIILTSYPGQSGVDPLPMEWGARDPQKRGRKSRLFQKIQMTQSPSSKFPSIACKLIQQPLVKP